MSDEKDLGDLRKRIAKRAERLSRVVLMDAGPFWMAREWELLSEAYYRFNFLARKERIEAMGTDDDEL